MRLPFFLENVYFIFLCNEMFKATVKYRKADIVIETEQQNYCKCVLKTVQRFLKFSKNTKL